MRFQLKVRPKSSKLSFRLLSADPLALEVSITQPPIKGEATKAAIAALAAELGIAPTRIRLISGKVSRHKILEVSAPDEPKLVEFVRTLSA